MTLTILPDDDERWSTILESVPFDHPILGSFSIETGGETIPYNLIHHENCTILIPTFEDHQNSLVPIIFLGRLTDFDEIRDYYRELMADF